MYVNINISINSVMWLTKSGWSLLGDICEVIKINNNSNININIFKYTNIWYNGC